MLININQYNPHERTIKQVVECIKDGGVIAYPTDTYYGIGCDIMNKKAIEKVYQLKQRDKKKPFSFLCSDLKDISKYAKVSNYAYRTMKRLLPGQYTFILEGTKLVPKIMLTKRKTAGIRVPNHQICTDLIKALGNPVLSTSATTEDRGILSEAWMIEDEFNNLVDIVIDGGDVPNLPSSVVTLFDDDPEVIREGAGDITIFL